MPYVHAPSQRPPARRAPRLCARGAGAHKHGMQSACAILTSPFPPCVARRDRLCAAASLRTQLTVMAARWGSALGSASTPVTAQGGRGTQRLSSLLLLLSARVCRGSSCAVGHEAWSCETPPDLEIATAQRNAWREQTARPPARPGSTISLLQAAPARRASTGAPAIPCRPCARPPVPTIRVNPQVQPFRGARPQLHLGGHTVRMFLTVPHPFCQLVGKELGYNWEAA